MFEDENFEGLDAMSMYYSNKILNILGFENLFDYESVVGRKNSIWVIKRVHRILPKMVCFS